MGSQDQHLQDARARRDPTREAMRRLREAVRVDPGSPFVAQAEALLDAWGREQLERKRAERVAAAERNAEHQQARKLAKERGKAVAAGAVDAGRLLLAVAAGRTGRPQHELAQLPRPELQALLAGLLEGADEKGGG